MIERYWGVMKVFRLCLFRALSAFIYSSLLSPTYAKQASLDVGDIESNKIETILFSLLSTEFQDRKIFEKKRTDKKPQTVANSDSFSLFCLG